MACLFMFLFIFGFANHRVHASENRVILKGRIEEIFDQKKVKFPNLKALTPRMDKLSKRRIHRVHASLKSYPAILRGEWKGVLTVKKAEFNPIYFEQSPADARADKYLFPVGRRCNAKFRFYGVGGGRIALDPDVKFQVGPDESAKVWNTRGRAIIHLNLGLARKGAKLRTNGQQSWLYEKVLMDKIKMLDNNLAEQNILTVNTATNIKTRKRRQFYSEHVSQFKKVESFRLHVSIAEVEYGPDGTWWKKLLFEGQVR